MLLGRTNTPTLKSYIVKCIYSRYNSNASCAIILTHYSTSATKANNYVVYCNTEITRHGRNGNIKEAESLFLRMPRKGIVSYTAMLTAYANNGQIGNAKKLFEEMPERNTVTWNAMVRGYIRNMSRRNEEIDEAFRLFLKMPQKNAVSHAVMITGFVNSGRLDDALSLYEDTPSVWRDPVCSNVLLKGYLRIGKLQEAVEVFERMVDKNVVSWSMMVDGYCKNGRLSEARKLFDMVEDGRNEFTWCSMIQGYLEMGCFEDGFGLFLQMRREGQIRTEPTLMTIILESCGRTDRYREGCQLHGLISQLGFAFDKFLGNSTVMMYSRLGYVTEARNLFNSMSEKDTVSWNSLLYGYVHAGRMDEACELFENAEVKDLFSWTTMITGFSNKGQTGKCFDLFNKMPKHDDISWTAVISGLVNNEQHEDAIHWFIQMLRSKIMPNPFTLSSLLSAAASLAFLGHGLQMHSLVFKTNMGHELSVQHSIISMYSKCGSAIDAYKIFKSITSPNIVSFNSMITGYAHNGYGEEALDLFRKMIDEGNQPNEVSFLGVLSACTHTGRVDEGRNYFMSMKSVFKVEPSPDHYACLIDLFGRAGLLNEATKLIMSMPVEPHAGVWGALLSASRIHKRLDLGKVAAKCILELEPDNATPYVVLSDMYGISGNRRDEEEMRLMKKLRGIKKSPGCSWITVKDKVELFLSGQKSCSNFEEIKNMLLTALYEMTELSCLDMEF